MFGWRGLCGVLGAAAIISLLVTSASAGVATGSSPPSSTVTASRFTAPTSSGTKRYLSLTPRAMSPRFASSSGPRRRGVKGDEREVRRPAAPSRRSALPAGLFCRDLRATGYSYTRVVHYWRMHGRPSQMDADRDRVPCETVYPASDVSAYWLAQANNNRPVAVVVSDNGDEARVWARRCARTIVANRKDTESRPIVGTPGNDRIIARRGPNVIYALAGADVVCGNAGDDTLFGGLGQDTLLGGVGNDTLLGDADNDTLDGGAGVNNVYGGDGYDTLRSGHGKDRLDGGRDFDICIGTLGIDIFSNCEVVQRQ